MTMMWKQTIMDYQHRGLQYGSPPYGGKRVDLGECWLSFSILGYLIRHEWKSGWENTVFCKCDWFSNQLSLSKEISSHGLWGLLQPVESSWEQNWCFSEDGRQSSCSVQPQLLPQSTQPCALPWMLWASRPHMAVNQAPHI